LKAEWEVEKVAKLLCTNNPAERPFAVAKAYMDIYGRMNLCTLAKFTLSMCNGSHSMAGPKGKQEKTKDRIVDEAGIAMTCDLRLKRAVTKLCTVRRCKPGGITVLVTTAFAQDKILANELRLANEVEEKARMAKQHLKKAIKFNVAAEEPLATTSILLHAQLKAMDYKKGVCMAYLKRQFDARLTRAEADNYSYDDLPARFRSQHTGKLMKNPTDEADPMAYLSDLVVAMIGVDSKRTFRAEIFLSGLIRSTPVLEAETTNPIATEAKKAMDDYLVSQAEQVDDPWLLLLEKEYKGQVCFLHDIAARHKLYCVARISYWASTKSHYANWEATLEPIHLAADGSYFVHDDDSVIGPGGKRITKAKSYRGYIVAQYIHGDDEDPERTVCVDEYIANALTKHATYLANSAAKQAAKSQAPPKRSATRRAANIQKQ
jgi:hypothetical protein